jgi:hypothetical protein
VRAGFQLAVVEPAPAKEPLRLFPWRLIRESVGEASRQFPNRPPFIEERIGGQQLGFLSTLSEGPVASRPPVQRHRPRRGTRREEHGENGSSTSEVNSQVRRAHRHRRRETLKLWDADPNLDESRGTPQLGLLWSGIFKERQGRGQTKKPCPLQGTYGRFPYFSVSRPGTRGGSGPERSDSRVERGIPAKKKLPGLPGATWASWGTGQKSGGSPAWLSISRPKQAKEKTGKRIEREQKKS